MDAHDLIVKKEENGFESEDNNINYLEIGVKVENNSSDIEDWCLENADYQGNIVYEEVENVKDEFEVYTCSICSWLTTDRQTLYQHNLIHLRVVVNQPKHLYQCDYCQCYLVSKLKMKLHIQTKHFLMLRNSKLPATKSLQQCTICDKVFSYKSLYTHMKEVHETVKYKCKECSVTFKCMRYLRRHMLYTHTDNKPSWRSHKVAVEGLDEFRCDLCPRVFINRNAYRTHLRNCHSDSYECTICHSILKCKTYFYAHMRRVHYNDGKTYKCDICGKEFKSPRYLNIHKKNSHLVKIKTIKTKKSRVKEDI